MPAFRVLRLTFPFFTNSSIESTTWATVYFSDAAMSLHRKGGG